MLIYILLSLWTIVQVVSGQNNSTNTTLPSTNITTPVPPPLPNINVNPVTTSSPPFRLQLQSHNKTLNNSFLSPLHEGAAIEALGYYHFTTPDQYNTFTLNTTTYVCTYDNGTIIPCNPSAPTNSTPPSIGVPGTLAWSLPASASSPNVSLALAFYPQELRLVPRGVSSNMNFAVIWFPNNPDDGFLGGPAQVAFDSEGYMNMQDDLLSARDAARTPFGDPFGGPKAYYRWFVCANTSFEFYEWSHLIWVSGAGRPDWGGVCDSVKVRRVWV